MSPIYRLTVLIWPLAAIAQMVSPQQAVTARLEYTGAPMKIAFSCNEEDLRQAGLSCTEKEPCPVYLELAAIAAAGGRVFVAGNIHTLSTTLYSILLMGESSARYWHEPFERLRSGVLDGVQFFDLETGWVSGYFLHNLPRDPFLLVTTDGGASWRLRPVAGEGHVGFIDWFHFDSRTHGSLWLDRSQSGEINALYERYESMTGGESWVLRQVTSRRTHGELPHTKSNSVLWRLSPNPAATSFLVERFQGNRWETLGAFAIQVANCKSGEP